MAQPSKAGPVVLTLFALPFLGGGLAFLYSQFVSQQNFKRSDALIGMAIGLFFVIVGGGLIFAAFKGYGVLKKQADLQDTNPTSPWLWRSDWALRRAASLSQKGYIAAWVLAALGNLFLFPFIFGMAPELMRQNTPVGLALLLGFGTLGVLLTIRAIRATIRHERFGNSYFEFDSLPFSLGERLGGRIHLRMEEQPAHGIDLSLKCVRRVITGSGKERSTSNITLWQADKNVPSGAVGPGPMGRAIPVEFELPSDAYQTDHNDSNDQVLWLLHAQADVPGVDYSDDFELPVFRTASSPQPGTEPAAQAPSFSQTTSAGRRLFGAASMPSIDGDSGAVPQPARTKVVVSMHDGGTEFYFPPLRTPGRAVLLLIAAAIFSGAVYLLLHSKVPLLFTGAFAASDLFIIYGFLHVAFGSPRIFVGNGEVRSPGGLLGLGAPRRTPFSEIDSIVPVASIQQGGSSDNSTHLIRLTTKAGKRFTLADEISSRQEARWVVLQIETLAGLKLDTRVEMDLPIGVSARPPQFGSTAAPRAKPQATVLASVAFVAFTAIFIALFAWRANNMFRNTARGSRAAAASRPALVKPRVFSGPMTDADITRVLALPVQAQAEELFERAITHDARALDLLNDHIDGWTGQLRRSPRMDQLVQRSSFSRDLRVRLANLDVSLALEGWQRNATAADALIERARTDPQHRAWAVYYLGMLAGRGVDYDRLHQVILDYGRNDKDPNVRQWAVEGLRFLGKDEVLDELYAAFTEDPSMNVRNRAGCNISDCGIFTRKQRMRMVPQLIDLAANPSTNSQMRNWCFMALNEITDASQPADALAWNRWYADHGAEKMAAFEKLEWWQVRGDE